MIEKLDIFAKPRGFSIDGTEKYKTQMGVACTIFFIISAFSAASLYTFRFINRKENPSVKSKFEYLEKSPTINLNKLNFVISLTGFVENKAIMPQQLLRTLSIKFAVGKRFVNLKNTLEEDLDLLDARPCKESDFTINGVNILTTAHLNDFTMSVCPQNDQLLIGGENLEKNSTFVKLIVEPCKLNCRPDAASIILYKDIRLKLGYSHASISEKNFTHPFKHYLVTNVEYPCYDTKSFQRKFFLRRVDISTDVGLFGEEKEVKSAVNFDRYYVEDRFRGTGDPYVDIEFYSSHHIKVVQRTYDKIPDTLSDIGGILSLVLSFVGATYKFYNKTRLKLHLVNKTILCTSVEYRHDEHEWKLFLSDIPKIYLYKIFNIFKLEKCFSERTKIKAGIFSGGIKRTHEYLDVNTVIQNSKDIEIFKKIFFNKYHTSCLDVLELDSLLIDDVEYLEFNVEVDLEEAYGEFFEKSNMKVNDPVDKKLNLFFDRHIDKLMKHKYVKEENIPKEFHYEEYKKIREKRKRKANKKMDKKRLKRVLSLLKPDEKKKYNESFEIFDERKRRAKRRMNELGSMISRISASRKQSRKNSNISSNNDKKPGSMEIGKNFKRSDKRKTTIDYMLGSRTKDIKEEDEKRMRSHRRRLSHKISSAGSRGKPFSFQRGFE